MANNLLCIDFDFFFENPMHGLDTDHPAFWFYDWGHREALTLDGRNADEWLWPIRAAGFLSHDFPLPQADVPEHFWDRFNITPDAQGYVHNSNMYSGPLPGRAFDAVWLYDAHHDLYKIETKEQLLDWAKGELQVTCENWMFVHYWDGAKLHWRYPRWIKRKRADVIGEVPKWVGLDARKDDGGKLDVEFSTVSICHSQAWVPPWCDRQFEAFYEKCPVDEMTQLDNVEFVREWDWDAVREHGEQLKVVEEQAREMNAQLQVHDESAPGG